MRIIKQDLRANAYHNIWWHIDWYKNDEIHREDGPAGICSDHYDIYILRNKSYLESDYWKEIHANY